MFQTGAEALLSDLTQLHGAIRRANNPKVIMRRVVDEAIALIGPADGAVLGLATDGKLTYVCGAGILADHLEDRSASARSLAAAAMHTGETLHCADAHNDDRVDAEVCRVSGACSVVCVPLRRQSEPLGVLGVVSRAPGAFGSEDVAMLATLGEFLAAAIGAACEISQIAEKLVPAEPTQAAASSAPAASAAATRPPRGRVGQFVANVLAPGLVADLEVRQRIQSMLAGPQFHVRCQPIVDLTSGEVVGAEALSRFPRAQEPADVWFADAHRVGLGIELQLAAVGIAVGMLDELPPGAFLTINVGPDVIAAPRLMELLEQVEAGRIVLELTEHIGIEDYPGLHASLSTIRDRGTRLAIDDTGAGFSSLGHIVHLSPELIKLDRQFTRGIDVDPVRRALAQALVAFGRETGSELVSEGIETAAELETVRDLGISYGQGYFIGRPMAARLLPHHLAHVSGVSDLVAGRARTTP